MNYLNEVPDGKAFYLGEKKIKSLNELLSALKGLSEDHYMHYAGEGHNYFADWVHHVVGHEKLAANLRNKSKDDAVKTLEKEIQVLKKPKVKKKPKQEKPAKDVVDSFTVSGTEKPQKEEKKEVVNETEDTDTMAMLEDIAQDEREIKQFLWKHFAWDMAKEFMYGLAIGILIGFVLSKIFLRV